MVLLKRSFKAEEQEDDGLAYVLRTMEEEIENVTAVERVEEEF